MRLPASIQPDRQAGPLQAARKLHKLGPTEEADVPGVGIIRLGTPVFMRNPAFVPHRESPMTPRYVVGVVMALFRAPDSPVASHVEASWLRETSVGSMVYLGTFT